MDHSVTLLPCVLGAAEVNLVNLERVGFNLRNFDMVLIMKVTRSYCRHFNCLTCRGRCCRCTTCCSFRC